MGNASPSAASQILVDYTALDDEGNPQAFTAPVAPPRKPRETGRADAARTGIRR